MNSNSAGMIEYFNVVGTYHVSPVALQMAKELAHSAALPLPGDHWIICYEWFFASRERRGKGKPWVETGPGLDVGGFRAGEVPKACVQVLDGVAIAAKIPWEILEAAPTRTIDVDPSQRSGLVLR